ncbi:TIGR02678 family protein [Anaerobacillus alkalidiazotrophicus]|uniref:TIGR02678 family protein n=1 Tax=Anaerobacillus alkalidiazotrophicus TaxID=472963 RepID=A0A1S2LW03_9BACI|nr:TIGR02678 family protein [Anaerobacillus alkalidiazotrophicus]OIJ16516.1 TIGR02678 family protein [Anaerobacillus alkalidiazotrophicus]
METGVFNEGLQLAIEALMENFIVERLNDTEVFRQILNNEKTIRRFVTENFGYQLKLDSDQAKLEKIPYFAREWMGIKEFKDELDYMFLMSILAYLEKKQPEDGFLLSDIIEEVKQFLSDVQSVDWKKRQDRKSFVTAMQFATEINLIYVRDGEIESFEESEKGEVLYFTTSVIRYMFRNFSKRIELLESVEEFLEDGLDIANPHHTLMRKIYFEPVVFFNELTKAERDYLAIHKNFEHFKTILEMYTGFELERSLECFYLVKKERKRYLQQHPHYTNESYIVTQVAKELASRLSVMEEKPLELWVLSDREFEHVLLETKRKNELAWSNGIRQASFSSYKEMVIKYVTEWKLAEYNKVTWDISIYPAFIRTLGEYNEEVKEYILKNRKEEGEVVG